MTPSEKHPKNEKGRKLVIRSELNLEQNSIFTVSTYKKKSREVVVRKTSPNGEITERRAIIGKTAGGIETGVLTTSHFKVYLVLLDLWEKEGKPIDTPVHFSILKIIKCLDLSYDGRTYARIKRWLLDLGQIPLTFVNSFFSPSEGIYRTLDPFHILSYLTIYERKKAGAEQKTYGYGEFRFDDHVLKNLIHNHTHPLRLDVIKSLKKHKDLAILLYTYLDRNLAFKEKYEIGLEKLFDHLDLSQRHVKYPSGRKRVIAPVLKQLEGKPLSTGVLSSLSIHKTKAGKDYKLICRKKPFRKVKTEERTPLPLESKPLEAEPPQELLSLLLQNGLTPSQAKNLFSEKGEEVIKAQLDYLPFRLKEYRAQKKEVKEAALLYASIQERWQPPNSYLEAEKKKEQEAKRQALKEEYRSRRQEIKAQAETWANQTPEEKIAPQLEFWITGEKLFHHRQPAEEEIQTKKEELIFYLPSRKKYEAWLRAKLESEFRSKGLP